MSAGITFAYGFILLILFGVYLAATTERTKRILGAVLTVFVAGFALTTVYPPFDQFDAHGKLTHKGKITLGLDLKGGTSFTVRLQPAEGDEPGTLRPITKEAVDQAVEVIRRRVDQMGTSEPVITPTGTDRILVQIPGLATEQLEEVKKQLQMVAKLDFRIVEPDNDNLLPAIEAKQKVLDPAWTVLPFAPKIQKDAKGDDIPEGPERKLIVHRVPDITGEHVTGAYAGFDVQGWHISIKFDKEAGDKFFELTRAMRVDQDRFAIVLDGKILSAPTTQVQGGIAGGSCIITGHFTEAEARGLASSLLNPLQNPVKIEEERSASASLGQDAITSGIKAGILGVSLIALVMLVYYRLSGLFANIALALTLTVIFGCMAMLHAVLTLPGIAGIILTVGMAVDANVLVFERLREELSHGKSFKVAVEAAFDRAFSAIFDANVTTLISSFILFIMASGPVRGFAVALSIGVIASLFSALVVSRALFAWSIEKGGLSSVSMMHIVQSTKINFLGYRKIALTFSLALVIASIGLFAARGDKMYSIDFKGGDLLVLEAQGTKPTDAEVREVCHSLGIKDEVVQSEKSAATGVEFVNVRSPKETGGTIKAALFEKFPGAKFKVSQEETVGSLVGDELKRSSATALVVGILGILIYISLRFEFSFAVGTIIALLHDVIITLGAFALFNKELSLVTVGAVLTIGGYSVNDTIVVFDRIRENIKSGRPGSLQELMNISVNDMLGRTFLTSGVTLIPTIGLFAFGVPILQDFGFTMLIGVVTGTYSSIFIAAPLVLWASGRGGRNLKSEVKRAGEKAALPA